MGNNCPDTNFRGISSGVAAYGDASWPFTSHLIVFFK